MDIFSYVIVEDSGFAPNPFGGFLTLACCKPRIRAVARVGDLVVGTGSQRTVGTTKLIYASQVSDVVRIEHYGVAPEYRVKRPSNAGSWWRQLGDNIYEPVQGKLVQRKNASHARTDIERDLSGRNVLICNRFWYFGDEPEEIPRQFRGIIKKGPAHKRISNGTLVRMFWKWLEQFPEGMRSIRHLTPVNTNCGCSTPLI